MSAIPMSAIPRMLPHALQASAQPASCYVAPTLVRQRKSVVSVGLAGQLERRQPDSDEAETRQAQARQAQLRQPEPTRRSDESQATWAFYRKHTERMLRQYLHASIQVGRSPELLEKSVGRGWGSSRKVKTFEDAVIFVLDIERCLQRMNGADRLLLERVVLQEYTYQEAAELMGLSLRVLARKVPAALDRLTELLVAYRLLVLAED